MAVGPVGYTAAIRAAQLGLGVALAERAELGGVCLNWGCIPTKSLLHTADVMREAASASELGLELGKPKFNLKKVVKRSRDVAAQLSGGIAHLMRKNKIAVFNGSAVFEDKNTVLVGEDRIFADNIIVATGASARDLPSHRSGWRENLGCPGCHDTGIHAEETADHWRRCHRCRVCEFLQYTRCQRHAG